VTEKGREKKRKKEAVLGPKKGAAEGLQFWPGLFYGGGGGRTNSPHHNEKSDPVCPSWDRVSTTPVGKGGKGNARGGKIAFLSLPRRSRREKKKGRCKRAHPKNRRKKRKTTKIAPLLSRSSCADNPAEREEAERKGKKVPIFKALRKGKSPPPKKEKKKSNSSLIVASENKKEGREYCIGKENLYSIFFPFVGGKKEEGAAAFRKIRT